MDAKVRSMTGYGRGEFTAEDRKFTVEMRSVNHRYNDITVKLPRFLISLEDRIKKKTAENVFRGKTDIYISFETLSSEDVEVKLDEALAAAYAEKLKHLREIIGVPQADDGRILELTARFPKILFEACASGGNRTDPGMLCYMPQVWLSDNTDALCRCRMQYNASFGYPQSVMGAHVSAVPNHQTLRNAPLDSRFQTAAFGLLGYELDLCSLPEREKTKVAGQIAFYKKYRGTLQFGRLYRLRGGEDGLWQMMAVSGDYGTALSLLLQQENRPNAAGVRLLARGLASGDVYRLSVRPVGTELAAFGSLVNMVSPVRVRPGSLSEAAEKLVRLPGEREELTASGDMLMKAGAWLKQGFSGTGFDGETRVNLVQAWDYHPDGTMTFNLLYTFERDQRIVQQEVFEEHYFPIPRQLLLDELARLGYGEIRLFPFPAMLRQGAEEAEWYCVLARKGPGGQRENHI